MSERSIKTEYREGLPSAAQVAAHVKHGGKWICRDGRERSVLQLCVCVRPGRNKGKILFWDIAAYEEPEWSILAGEYTCEAEFRMVCRDLFAMPWPEKST